MASVSNWLAIAVGGVGGTLAAIAGSASPPPAPAHEPLPPVAAVSAQVQAATPAAASAALSESATPSASAGPLASAALASTDSAASTPAASAAREGASASPSTLPAPATSADASPLPNTPKALLRTEMHCDEGKSEACIVAARSYESGSAGVTDSAKAEKYRRIALTMWISHCDHNSAAACVTLSKLYRAGEGVPQSDRNADALLERARELCRYTFVPVCNELPSP